jgi:hypothetical protein
VPLEVVLKQLQVYPDQWIQVAPGAFTYTYMLNTTDDKTVYLTVGATNIGQRNVINIGPAPTMFGALDLPSLVMSGQPLSLQLNSSATDFASLAGNSTGWRLSLTKPDSSTVDLGLMADWDVWSGVVYKWNMTVAGSHFAQGWW